MELDKSFIPSFRFYEASKYMYDKESNKQCIEPRLTD